MHVIGLTGGIASGKSTVSQMLRELGAHILDADQVAREVVQPGQPALEEIRRHFPEVVDEHGRLDRAKLGERVFRDEAARQTLNSIVHPRVREAVAEKTAAFAEQGVSELIYDVPLLIENRLHEGMNGVILVVVPPHIQLERLIARDHLSEEQARARIAAQLPLEEKLKYATWVVDNAGSREETRAQVEAVWQSVKRLA